MADFNMRFDFNFYSSILLIFFVHAVVYAFLLWIRGRQQEAHRGDQWLALFLILAALYIMPWMVGFAGWYDNQPYRDILFYTPFQHILWIGPVVYFYVQSILNPAFIVDRKQWIHFVPGLIFILFHFVMVVVDKLILKEYYFLASGQDPDFLTLYQVVGTASMLIYFWLSYRYYRLYRKLMVQVISYADQVVFEWIHVFLSIFILMLLTKILFFIAGLLVDLDYIGNWWYYLVFSILTYFIAIRGYSNQQKATIRFEPNLLQFQPKLIADSSSVAENWEEPIEVLDPIQPGDISQVIDPLLEEKKAQIQQLMEIDRWYENPTLSLADIAKHMESNPSQVSRLINQGFSLNFNDFVNGFRVRAFQEKIKAGEHKKQTLLGVAYDCGFNSKATFNRAFKKCTDLNPKDWVATYTGA
jgi:AraC-like DNA-binding protein